MQQELLNKPEPYAPIGVKWWIRMNFIDSHRDGTGARIAAEVVAEVPWRQKTDLESSRLVVRCRRCTGQRFNVAYEDRTEQNRQDAPTCR